MISPQVTSELIDAIRDGSQPTAVETHLAHIMAKWGVRDRVQTLVRAARADIVRLT